jgi:hypothetical protein
MDTRKLQEAVTELEAESVSCLRVAAELKDIIRRHANGAGSGAPTFSPIAASSKDPSEMSWLELGMAVLAENGGQMRMKDLLPLVVKKGGRETARANVEGALIRGMKSGKVFRPKPGVFALGQRTQ